ncbi:ORF 2; putative [Pseudomonas aeruginosa]|uniref:Uncharacterized protein n=1 Tax=Pseudomonas aeruginosa TaxID=287 RepID=Q8VVL7_PSEAI|nr:ORF 2; putative [Pseudomonas aeruginosa PAO1]CEI78827.1 ORF 2; putative [Pseudomonas aeruginosa]
MRAATFAIFSAIVDITCALWKCGRRRLDALETAGLDGHLPVPVSRFRVWRRTPRVSWKHPGSSGVFLVRDGGFGGILPACL